MAGFIYDNQIEKDVAPFSPMEGMVMKDYLLITEPTCSDPAGLKTWLDRSNDYLLSLPPKVKKNENSLFEPSEKHFKLPECSGH